MRDDRSSANPKEQIVDLRRVKVQNTAGPSSQELAEALAQLIDVLDAPSRLPGLVKIAENVLALLDPDSGVPIPKELVSKIPGWKSVLGWIESDAETIAKTIFDNPKEEERFLRKANKNPVQGQGAISSPIYCQLWEVHPDPRFTAKFRILQGHLMFAHFDVRNMICSIDCGYEDDQRRVAREHLYRTTYPLQEIASLKATEDVGDPVQKPFAAIRPNLSGAAFTDKLWDYRENLPDANHELRDCLGPLLHLIDWSLTSSYKPEPRQASDSSIRRAPLTVIPVPASDSPDSQKDDSRNERSPGPEPSRRGGGDSVPAGAPVYVLSSQEEEFDDLDEASFSEDDAKNRPHRARTGVSHHTKVKTEQRLSEEILATGDNPERYLTSDSIDLTEDVRGVLLDGGGWQEMRNQYLPWSLSELADEELADAWLRLERHSQTGDPESVELFALVNVLLWTGRLPKEVLNLKVRTVSEDFAAELSFYLPVVPSSPSTAEWRIRPLPIRHSIPLTEPIQLDGRDVACQLSRCQTTPV